MLVLPVINCRDAETANANIKKAAAFSNWIHIDIIDGQFAPGTTWGDPSVLSGLKQQFPGMHFEIHLMVQEPEDVARNWLDAGADRVIIPLETMKDPGSTLNEARRHGAEIMLSISPSTPAENLIPYLPSFTAFQVLSVNPGPTGQKFLPGAIDKVRFIEKSRPTAVIEVDGGIDFKVCKSLSEAGASAVASATYIFSGPDPKRAYKELASC
jgi:ribulose-phosphate 3-epimerase